MLKVQRYRAGPYRLASLDELYSLGVAEGIAIPAEIKTAC